jgi:hypothetical protein
VKLPFLKRFLGPQPASSDARSRIVGGVAFLSTFATSFYVIAAWVYPLLPPFGQALCGFPLSAAFVYSVYIGSCAEAGARWKAGALKASPTESGAAAPVLSASATVSAPDADKQSAPVVHASIEQIREGLPPRARFICAAQGIATASGIGIVLIGLAIGVSWTFPKPLQILIGIVIPFLGLIALHYGRFTYRDSLLRARRRQGLGEPG